MAKGSNQKAKLLRILELLKKKTDLEHRLTTQEIIEELDKLEISAERKSIYSDMQCLTDLGYDILCDKTKNKGFYLASRDIEKYELIPLVDAISSSKFITEKKSRELIKKLEGLLSVYDAVDLDRSVYVCDRIKSDNESIFYTLDAIHNAINQHKKISFLYCEWNVNKELVPRRDGKTYLINPLGLTWDDEKYYLIGFDDFAGEIRHYRADKMKSVEITEEKITDNEIINKFDIVSYCNKTFGMYGGKEETVTLLFPSSMAGVCIDRFGKEPTFRKTLNDEYFTVRVNITVSNQFFGWLTGLSMGVKIVSPQWVADEYKEYLKKILLNY